ncbi:MAG: IclR family transcriptional regulator [Dehalococcoidales bacterium]|nr:IclR family transcriptional regulator [Dehalococcoidales bacterium]
MENVSGTVNKAIDILEAFLAEDAELGLTELSRITGYNNATIYRLLSTMANRGLVYQGNKKGKYSLGLKTLEFSHTVRMHLGYLDITYLHLSKLCRDNNIAVNLTAHDSDAELVIDEIGMMNEFRPTAPIGKRLPSYATANGKLSLAFLTDEERTAYFQRNTLKPITRYTITDISKLNKQFNTIRREEIAFDDEEYVHGIKAVASPIYDYQRKIMCIAVALLPAAIFDSNCVKKIAVGLKNCTKEISIVTGRLI